MPTEQEVGHGSRSHSYTYDGRACAYAKGMEKFVFVLGLADGVLDFTSGQEFVISLKHLLPKKRRNKVRLKKECPRIFPML